MCFYPIILKYPWQESFCTVYKCQCSKWSHCSSTWIQMFWCSPWSLWFDAGLEVLGPQISWKSLWIKILLLVDPLFSWNSQTHESKGHKARSTTPTGPYVPQETHMGSGHFTRLQGQKQVHMTTESTKISNVLKFR